MRKLIAVVLIALPLSGCTGLVAGPDFGPSSTAAQNLGAHIVRVEFEVGSSCSSMEPAMTAYANRGARVLALAGFSGYMPTTGQAQSVLQWAQCFGPGSTWASQHENFALDLIEFGNETSYRYQYGDPDGPGPGDDWWASAQYVSRAQTYAVRFGAARQALDLGGFADNVKLLAQADDGGSGSSSWVHNLKVGGLASGSIGGWTVHPYGPDPTAKLGRVVSFTGAEGFSSAIPIYVTEIGIATDECTPGVGRSLDGNHGWPVNLNYSQAATNLESSLDTIRSYLGSRLAMSMIYKVKDDAAPCVGQSEQHYGAVKSDLSAKGTYTTEVQDQLDE